LVTAELTDGKILAVSGHTCSRGEKYARAELTNPTRVITSTVRVTGGDIPTASVKTNIAAPKSKIKEFIDALKGVEIAAPVEIGDAILKNVAGTSVDFVATKAVKAIKKIKI
jgi:CxxC motif-containing protein